MFTLVIRSSWLVSLYCPGQWLMGVMARSDRQWLMGVMARSDRQWLMGVMARSDTCQRGPLGLCGWFPAPCGIYVWKRSRESRFGLCILIYLYIWSFSLSVIAPLLMLALCVCVCEWL